MECLTAVTVAGCARRHLLLELGAVNRALTAAVERQARSAARLARPDLTTLCVTDEQVLQLLRDVGTLGQAEVPAADGHPEGGSAATLALRKASGDRLPLDCLGRELGLTPFERFAILLGAAHEVDRRYERIFAYVLDDLNRRQPSVELLCTLAGGDAETVLANRQTAGRYGRLRRGGLLLAVGDPPSELRQEFRLAPGLMHWLLSGQGDATAFTDPAEVPLLQAGPPPGVSPLLITRLGRALGIGEVSVAGVFGPRGTSRAASVRALAVAAGRPLRRLSAESVSLLEEGLATAAALGAIVWLEVDSLLESGTESNHELLAARLAARRTPLILSGACPWRPTELLAVRPYAEVELDRPDWVARQAMWAAAFPEASGARHADLAGRMAMSDAEIAAVARVARASARVRGNGAPLPLDDVIDDACAAVARKRSDRFAVRVHPARGPDDLILPADLHRQVLEVARFFRALPRVSEAWRFGRLMTGRGGLKALFTGDSGTGKTLAAEVVAGELGLPLLKIDLARVTSKWVGETEKNLDVAFREAEESHSVLFVDEADALCGRRGDVGRGTDRWANLEVSFLLQRLEEHPGLVILASNLRAQIDDAFIRRFHIVLHFPRPAVEERRRLWALALPAEAPLLGDVDLAALAQLDLTGAGIVGTAHTAALLAADDGAIGMQHLVQAAHRQFHREARLLTGLDLKHQTQAPPGA
jgi:hypothetical protein